LSSTVKVEGAIEAKLVSAHKVFDLWLGYQMDSNGCETLQDQIIDENRLAHQIWDLLEEFSNVDLKNPRKGQKWVSS